MFNFNLCVSEKGRKKWCEKLVVIKEEHLRGYVGKFEYVRYVSGSKRSKKENRILYKII